MITLTKYDNRKLYSKDLSRYVTQKELITLIKLGQQVKVETKEGVDVTPDVHVELVKAHLKNNPISFTDMVKLFNK